MALNIRRIQMKTTFTTTNSKLHKFAQILAVVTSKGRKARAISKFGRLASEKIEEWTESQKELIATYYEVQENGNAKLDKDGSPVLLDGADQDEYAKEREELDNEIVVIDLTEFEPFYDFLVSGLDESDIAFGGVDADVYDELMDQLEELGGKE